jgi:hypothetical protein
MVAANRDHPGSDLPQSPVAWLDPTTPAIRRQAVDWNIPGIDDPPVGVRLSEHAVKAPAYRRSKAHRTRSVARARAFRDPAVEGDPEDANVGARTYSINWKAKERRYVGSVGELIGIHGAVRRAAGRVSLFRSALPRT